MRVLVVSYHPLEGSFTAATTARVLDTLARSGRHTIRHRDLHADGQTAAWTTPPDPPGSGPTPVADLRWCEAIVFVYPTWWSGQPAALTGWLQSTLAELTDRHDGSHTARPLRNVRRFAAVTSHGSSKLVNVAQGEGGKRVLSRGLRSRCHPLARMSWIALYGIDRSTTRSRDRFLDRITRRLGSW